MDWVLLSLVSAVAFTAVTIVQKRTLDRHINGGVTFNAAAAVFQLTVAVVLVSLFPIDWFSRGMAVMLGVGFFQALTWLLQSYAIARETDISRIVPALDAFPLPVLIIAVVLLGESLTPMKATAAFMVIGGAVWASWHEALPGNRVKINRSFFAIVGAMLSISVMTVLYKVASADLSVVQLVGTAWLVSAPIHLAAAAVTRSAGDVVSVFRSRPAFGMLGLTQIGMLVAIFTGLAAISLGPVSLTTAIMSTRPVLIVLWAMALGFSFKRTKASGEPRAMRSRLASASLVTVGVGAMAF